MSTLLSPIHQLETRVGTELLVGKRVVIVEDEGMTQMQLQSILRKAGMTLVGSAGNGRTGVELVLREKPDIVLMDVKMPIMNGLDAASEILAVQRVCIVVISAYSELTIRERAYHLGTCGMIVKPVSREQLLPELAAAYQLFEQTLSTPRQLR